MAPQGAVFVADGSKLDRRSRTDRKANSVSGGLKNVNLTEFGALTFPLPPLAEQHRIVAKVDELMALCDRLEANLTAAGRLLQSP
jgi:restriction endonuclease S subunit